MTVRCAMWAALALVVLVTAALGGVRAQQCTAYVSPGGSSTDPLCGGSPAQPCALGFVLRTNCTALTVRMSAGRYNSTADCGVTLNATAQSVTIVGPNTDPAHSSTVALSGLSTRSSMDASVSAVWDCSSFTIPAVLTTGQPMDAVAVYNVTLLAPQAPPSSQTATSWLATPSIRGVLNVTDCRLTGFAPFVLKPATCLTTQPPAVCTWTARVLIVNNEAYWPGAFQTFLEVYSGPAADGSALPSVPLTVAFNVWTAHDLTMRAGVFEVRSTSADLLIAAHNETVGSYITYMTVFASGSLSGGLTLRGVRSSSDAFIQLLTYNAVATSATLIVIDDYAGGLTTVANVQASAASVELHVVNSQFWVNRLFESQATAVALSVTGVSATITDVSFSSEAGQFVSIGPSPTQAVTMTRVDFRQFDATRFDSSVATGCLVLLSTVATLQDVTFSGCGAKVPGGGMAVLDTALVMTGGGFTGCSAPEGGSMFVSTTVSGGAADSVISGVGVFISGTGSQVGGAFSLRGLSRVTFDQCHFQSCLSLTGATFYVADSADVTLSNSRIVAGFPSVAGGAAAITGSARMTIVNTTIRDSGSNGVGIPGGAFSVDTFAFLSLQSCVVTDCLGDSVVSVRMAATFIDIGSNFTFHTRASHVFKALDQSQVTLTGTVFTQSNTQLFAQPNFVVSDSSQLLTVSVTGVQFIGSTGTSVQLAPGGGYFGYPLSFDRCLFSGNRVGALQSALPVNITNSRFQYNSNFVFGTGGAIALSGGSHFLSNIDFVGNSACAGGAIIVDVLAFQYVLPMRFINNSAVQQSPQSCPIVYGGAMAWSLSNPHDKDLIPTNFGADFELIGNTAPVAPNIGSSVAAMAMTIGLDGPLLNATQNTASVFAGMPTDVYVYLYDAFGNAMTATNQWAVSAAWGCNGNDHSRDVVRTGTATNGVAHLASMSLGGAAPNDTIVVPCTMVLSGANSPPSYLSIFVQLTECPVGWGYSSALLACTPCAEGTYSARVDLAPCRPCPSDVACPGLDPASNSTASQIIVQTPFPLTGFWTGPANAEGVLIAEPCPPGLCETPAGLTRSAETVCATGRDFASPLCGACLPGYSNWGEQCIPCNKVSGGSVVASVLVAWAYVVVQHALVQDSFGRFTNFYFFGQVASFLMYPESLPAAFPAIMRNTIAIFSSSDCPFPVGPWGRVFVGVVQALWVFPFLALTMAVHRLLLRWCGTPDGGGNGCCHSCSCCAISGPAALKASRPMADDGRADDWQRKLAAGRIVFRAYSSIAAYKRTALVFIITSYGPIAELTFNVFACEPVAGVYVASKSPDLHCGDAQWRTALIAFVPLALWVIGLPIWLAYALVSVSGVAPPGVAVVGGADPLLPGSPSIPPMRRGSVSSAASIVWSMLTPHLRPGWYLWEVWGLVRRFLLLSVFTILATSGVEVAGQRFAYTCLLCVYLVVHMQAQPFVSSITGHLETLSLTALTLLAAGLASASLFAEPLNSLSGPMHATLFSVFVVVGAVLLTVLILPLLPCQRLATACEGSARKDEADGPKTATVLC